MKLQNHHEFYQLNHPLAPTKGRSIGTMKLGKIRGPQLVRIQRPLPSWARAAGAPLRACHDLALGQMPVPHDAPAAVVGFQIGGRGQKPGHFRLNRLNKSARAPSRRTSVNRSVRVRHDIGFQFSSSKKRLNSLPHPANACSARFLSTKAFMDFAKRQARMCEHVRRSTTSSVKGIRIFLWLRPNLSPSAFQTNSRCAPRRPTRSRLLP